MSVDLSVGRQDGEWIIIESLPANFRKGRPIRPMLHLSGGVLLRTSDHASTTPWLKRPYEWIKQVIIQNSIISSVSEVTLACSLHNAFLVAHKAVIIKAFPQMRLRYCWLSMWFIMLFPQRHHWQIALLKMISGPILAVDRYLQRIRGIHSLY